MRRFLPPAHSPIRIAALASGVRALIFPRLTDKTRLTGEIAARTGSEVVHLLDSGTSALKLAVRIAAARRPGRPIAIPSWACYDLASAVIGENIPVALYDIDPHTLCPQPSTIASIAKVDPCAIVLVHFFGIPVDISKIRAILDARTPIIEDCAQSWGGTYRNRPLGSEGDFAIFSFGRGKGITGGSGGALASRRNIHMTPDAPSPAPESAPRRGIQDVTLSIAQWALSNPTVYALPASIPSLKLGEARFRAPHPIAPISDAAAAIASRNIDVANSAARKRRLRANEYVRALPAEWTVGISASAEPSWLRFPILAPNTATKKNWLVRFRNLGLASGYPKPLSAILDAHSCPYSTSHDIVGGSKLADCLVTLPTHELIGIDDAQEIARQLTITVSDTI